MKGLTTEAKNAKPGDILTCKGELVKYKSTLEFNFGTIISLVEGELPETPVNPDSDSATIDFADAANRISCTDEAQVWEQNGVKVTNNQGASTSPVKDYTAPVRFYKSSQVIVEYVGMQKIVFNCNTADYATALKNSITAADGYTVSVSDKAVKVIFTAPVPNSLSTIALASSRLAFSRQFAFTAISLPPSFLISFANFSAASRLMSRSATLAPHAASAFAKSEQRIPPAPVTTATLSFKSG